MTKWQALSIARKIELAAEIENSWPRLECLWALQHAIEHYAETLPAPIDDRHLLDGVAKDRLADECHGYDLDGNPLA